MSQESRTSGSEVLIEGYPGILALAPSSTMIVEEAVEPLRDINCEEESEDSELVSEALEDLRSEREEAVAIDRLLAPSDTYEGLLAFTMFPSESRQSLFRVARTPNPSPPASSSFSLWRDMCRSLGYVRPSYPDHCSETYREGHDDGSEPCSEDMYYFHLCGSMRDGEDVQIGRMTFHN